MILIYRYLIAFGLVIGGTYALYSMAVQHGADQALKEAEASKARAIERAVKERQALEAQLAERAQADYETLEQMRKDLEKARGDAEQAKQTKQDLASDQDYKPPQAQTPKAPKAPRAYDAVVFDQSWSSWLSDGKSKSRH
jgi:hypothetical protein